jgi:hypothetical protein
MAYKSAYGKTHLYDETVAFAEEKSFLEGWIHPMVQLDAMKVMLVIAHSANTFGKQSLRERAIARRAELATKEELTKQEKLELSMMVCTSLKLKSFIKDADMRAFYVELAAPAVQAVQAVQAITLVV